MPDVPNLTTATQSVVVPRRSLRLRLTAPITSCAIPLLAFTLLFATTDAPRSSAAAPTLQLMSQVGGEVSGIGTSPPYVYVATGPRVLVYDASDPARPFVAGQSEVLPGRITALAVAGVRAVATLESPDAIVMLDLSTPLRPTGTTLLWTTPPRAVAISNRAAFISDGNTVQVLDLAFSQTPHFLGSYPAVNQLAASDDLLLVAASGALHLVNVADLTHPTAIGKFDTPRLCATAVAVSGPLAVLGGSASIGCTGGLYVLDVSDPVHPAQRAFLPNYSVSRLALVGRMAYIDGVRLLDLTDPVTPKPRGSYGTSSFYGTVTTVAGGYAYLAGHAESWQGPRPDWSPATFRVVTLADPDNLRLIGSADNVGQARLLARSSDMLYVVEGSTDTIRVLDIADPAAPRLRGTAPPGSARALAGGDGYLFAGTNQGFRVLDVHDPAHITELANFNFRFFGEQIALADNRLYLLGTASYGAPGAPGCCGQELRVLDVTNPIDVPALLVYRMPRTASAFVVEGTLVYFIEPSAAGGPGGLRILDISDYANPHEIGYTDLNGHPRGLTKAGSYLYIAEAPIYHPHRSEGGGLRIVDVRYPDRPTTASYLPIPQGAAKVAVAGGVAFVAKLNPSATDFDSLLAVDVSRAASPSQIAEALLPGGDGNITAHDQTVMVSTTPAGLYLFQLSSFTPAPPAGPPPPPSVDAKIEIVWPQSGSGIGSDRVNVGIYLFLPDSAQTVACQWEPEVHLWKAVNNEPARDVGVAQKWTSYLPVGSRSIAVPAWQLNDVDVSEARDPLSKVYFFVTVAGVPTRSNLWSHGEDARTYFPVQDQPTGVGASGAIDAKIEVVWPHNNTPGEQVNLVNIGSMLFQRGTLNAVPTGYAGAVTLYGGLNQEVQEPLAVGQKRIVSAGVVPYPVWDFNDVDVSQARDPLNKYYFTVGVTGQDVRSNVWSHGADARTYFPQKDTPSNDCR